MVTEELKLEVSRLHKLEGSGSTKAFCDLSIGESLVIKGLRVVEGEKGLFVSMPREEGKDGKWYDIVKILDDELKQEFQDKVLEAYNS